MKVFSHFSEEAATIDLIQALESTLTMAKIEYKYVADVQSDFNEIPAVECYGSEMNQVFLNLLVNAAHAIQDTGQRGLITIKTRKYYDDMVEIAIGDTGTGIPEKVRPKIFDHFFTTKGVGKGTGQGLSIAYQIVVRKHGGTLTFETEMGKGTTFFIRLPLIARILDKKEEDPSDEPAADLIC
jgi:signal transduction histidine kinase